MAHIPDGVLTLPVLLGAAGVTAAAVGLGLRGLDDRGILRVALLAAVFFAASLVAVPVGPSSVHLMLSGLMGVMLGLGVFPAVLVALALQAVLFGIGGLTTLGVNTLNIAGPGALVGLALGGLVRGLAARGRPARAGLVAGVGAALAVALTAGGVAAALAISAPEFVPVAKVLAVTYLPLAVAEAVITGVVVAFLARVEPKALHPVLATNGGQA